MRTEWQGRPYPWAYNEDESVKTWGVRLPDGSTPEPGDRVRVTTKSGKEFSGEVAETQEIDGTVLVLLSKDRDKAKRGGNGGGKRHGYTAPPERSPSSEAMQAMNIVAALEREVETLSTRVMMVESESTVLKSRLNKASKAHAALTKRVDLLAQQLTAGAK